MLHFIWKKEALVLMHPFLDVFSYLLHRYESVCFPCLVVLSTAVSSQWCVRLLNLQYVRVREEFLYLMTVLDVIELIQQHQKGMLLLTFYDHLFESRTRQTISERLVLLQLIYCLNRRNYLFSL